MARGTNAIRVAVIGREPGVVEDCAQPRSGVMACLTSGREPRRNVVWVVRSLVIRLMAAVTSRWQRRVVVVHVTLRTGDVHVKARQRKRCQVMIKRRLQPRRGVVTHLASVRETRRGMWRVVGRVVIRHMTSRAGRIGQVVIPIHMALRARSS